MELVLRGLAVYLLLLLILRAAGHRQLSELSTFDFVLVLILAEVTQQALVGQDYSFTAAAVLIVTLVGADIAVSLAKRRFKPLDKVVSGSPLLLIENGKLVKENMDRERVDPSDILTEARLNHGLERLDQIKYAVLETSGKIAIVPAQQG